MKKRYRIVSLFVLACFFANTVAYGNAVNCAAGYCSNQANLAPALMCGDLSGIAGKDVGRIRAYLLAQLMGLEYYNAAGIQIYEEEVSVREGMRVKCRISDDLGPRTYYAVYSPASDEEDEFLIKGIYTEKEFDEFAQLTGTLPKRPIEDEKMIDRYVEHEEGLDYILNYAHENNFAKKPLRSVFDYRGTVLGLFKKLNLEVITPKGVIPIEDRDFFLVNLVKIPDSLPDKKFMVTVVDLEGREYKTSFFAHSSNRSVHVILTSFQFEGLVSENGPENDKFFLYHKRIRKRQ